LIKFGQFANYKGKETPAKALNKGQKQSLQSGVKIS